MVIIDWVLALSIWDHRIHGRHFPQAVEPAPGWGGLRPSARDSQGADCLRLGELVADIRAVAASGDAIDPAVASWLLEGYCQVAGADGSHVIGHPLCA